jgi:hypothetical protein
MRRDVRSIGGATMSKHTWSAAFIATVTIAAWAQPLRWSGDARLRLALIDAPMTIEASFGDFAFTPPGGTWKMPLTGSFYCDGLALDSVSFTRNEETDLPAIFRSFDVVVGLRAWPQADDKVTDLEFVAIDGERELRLGVIAGIAVRAGESTSFSHTFLLNAYDFDSFFASGTVPDLRVKRTTRSL